MAGLRDPKQFIGPAIGQNADYWSTMEAAARQRAEDARAQTAADQATRPVMAQPPGMAEQVREQQLRQSAQSGDVHTRAFQGSLESLTGQSAYFAGHALNHLGKVLDTTSPLRDTANALGLQTIGAGLNRFAEEKAQQAAMYAGPKYETDLAEAAKTGNLPSYALNAMGSGLASLVLGGVGAGLARTASRAALAPEIGYAATSYFPQAGGNLERTLRENPGIDEGTALRTAATGAVAQTALDVGPELKLFHWAANPALDAGKATLGHIAKRTGQALAAGVPSEFVTGGLQNVIEQGQSQVAGGRPLDIDRYEVLNNAMQEGLGGAHVMAGGGALRGTAEAANAAVQGGLGLGEKGWNLIPQGAKDFVADHGGRVVAKGASLAGDAKDVAAAAVRGFKAGDDDTTLPARMFAGARSATHVAQALHHIHNDQQVQVVAQSQDVAASNPHIHAAATVAHEAISQQELESEFDKLGAMWEIAQQQPTFRENEHRLMAVVEQAVTTGTPEAIAAAKQALTEYNPPVKNQRSSKVAHPAERATLFKELVPFAQALHEAGLLESQSQRPLAQQVLKAAAEVIQLHKRAVQAGGSTTLGKAEDGSKLTFKNLFLKAVGNILGPDVEGAATPLNAQLNELMNAHMAKMGEIRGDKKALQRVGQPRSVLQSLETGIYGAVKDGSYISQPWGKLPVADRAQMMHGWVQQYTHGTPLEELRADVRANVGSKNTDRILGVVQKLVDETKSGDYPEKLAGHVTSRAIIDDWIGMVRSGKNPMESITQMVGKKWAPLYYAKIGEMANMDSRRLGYATQQMQDALMGKAKNHQAALERITGVGQNAEEDARDFGGANSAYETVAASQEEADQSDIDIAAAPAPFEVRSDAVPVGQRFVGRLMRGRAATATATGNDKGVTRNRRGGNDLMEMEPISPHELTQSRSYFGDENYDADKDLNEMADKVVAENENRRKEVQRVLDKAHISSKEAKQAIARARSGISSLITDDMRDPITKEPIREKLPRVGIQSMLQDIYAADERFTPEVRQALADLAHFDRVGETYKELKETNPTDYGDQLFQRHEHRFVAERPWSTKHESLRDLDFDRGEYTTAALPDEDMDALDMLGHGLLHLSESEYLDMNKLVAAALPYGMTFDKLGVRGKIDVLTSVFTYLASSHALKEARETEGSALNRLVGALQGFNPALTSFAKGARSRVKLKDIGKPSKRFRTSELGPDGKEVGVPVEMKTQVLEELKSLGTKSQSLLALTALYVKEGDGKQTSTSFLDVLNQISDPAKLDETAVKSFVTPIDKTGLQATHLAAEQGGRPVKIDIPALVAHVLRAHGNEAVDDNLNKWQALSALYHGLNSLARYGVTAPGYEDAAFSKLQYWAAPDSELTLNAPQLNILRNTPDPAKPAEILGVSVIRDPGTLASGYNNGGKLLGMYFLRDMIASKISEAADPANALRKDKADKLTKLKDVLPKSEPAADRRRAMRSDFVSRVNSEATRLMRDIAALEKAVEGAVPVDVKKAIGEARGLIRSIADKFIEDATSHNEHGEDSFGVDLSEAFVPAEIPLLQALLQHTTRNILAVEWGREEPFVQETVDFGDSAKRTAATPTWTKTENGKERSVPLSDPDRPLRQGEETLPAGYSPAVHQFTQGIQTNNMRVLSGAIMSMETTADIGAAAEMAQRILGAVPPSIAKALNDRAVRIAEKSDPNHMGVEQAVANAEDKWFNKQAYLAVDQKLPITHAALLVRSGKGWALKVGEHTLAVLNVKSALVKNRLNPIDEVTKGIPGTLTFLPAELGGETQAVVFETAAPQSTSSGITTLNVVQRATARQKASAALMRGKQVPAAALKGNKNYPPKAPLGVKDTPALRAQQQVLEQPGTAPKSAAGPEPTLAAREAAKPNEPYSGPQYSAESQRRVPPPSRAGPTEEESNALAGVDSEKDLNIARHRALKEALKNPRGVPRMAREAIQPAISEAVRKVGADAIKAGQATKESEPKTQRTALPIKGKAKNSRITGEYNGLNPEVQQIIQNILKHLLGDKALAKFGVTDLGPDIAAQVDGKKEAQAFIIKFGTMLANPMTTAYHEAIHPLIAMMREMNDPKAQRIVRALEKAASSPVVLNQIYARLKDDPELLKAVKNDIENDPEEAVAYAFQMWAAGEIKLGPQTNDVLQQLARVILGWLGMTDKYMNLENFFNAFAEGKLNQKEFKLNALADAMGQTRIDKMAERGALLMGPIADMARYTFGSLTTPVRHIAKEFNLPAMAEIADLYDKHGSGYIWRYHTASRKLASEYNMLREDLHAEHGADKAREMLNNALAEVRLGKVQSDEAKKLKAIVDKILAYGDIKEPPMVFDYREVARNRDRLASDVEQFGEVNDSDMAVNDQIMMALNDYGVSGVHREGTWQIKFKPEHADVQEKWVQKDADSWMRQVIMQTVKKTEHEAIFGKPGGPGEMPPVLKKLLEKAKDQGMKPHQRAEIMKMIDAAEGKLGRNMSPKIREFMKDATVAMNVLMLPLAIFSAMVEPFAVAARANDLTQIGQAYAKGVGSIGATIMSAFGKIDRSEIATFAELAGVIEYTTMVDSLGDLWAGDSMFGKAKKIGDWFFKWNMLDGWGRAMRVAATEAALDFIADHYQKADWNAADEKSDMSYRFMKQLQLKQGDIMIKDGKVVLSQLHDETMTAAQEKALHLAVNIFVDEAAIRPNIATGSMWMADHRMMWLSHMKRFTWAFDHLVLQRAMSEAGHGNLAPYGILLASAPVAYASTVLREAIKPGNAAWLDKMDVMNTINYSMTKAGLAGRLQYLGDLLSDPDYGVEQILGPEFGQLLRTLKEAHRGGIGDALWANMPGHQLFGGGVQMTGKEPSKAGTLVQFADLFI